MAVISGYLLETLRERGEFTLYRGRRHADPSPVLLVALTAEQPSPQNLRRLEQEYSLAADLDPTWAARPLEITSHEGRTILVLKDPGGEPLDRVLEWGQGQPLDPTRFLRIAIGLAAALGEVHRRGLIHKDIKPANVLVDDDGNVWLTGFGIASRRPRERQAPAPPETIAGTLAYMAPEQTGRMNRSVDSRSDLYALGVTLYQMLTGSLPFTASDPMEWVHCHIARQPASPDERIPSIPRQLSVIVLKLLAKAAEDRYQTAAGLESDLRRCLAHWESHGRIDAFPMGAHDGSDQFRIPEKLYGREREIDALLAAFDRVVADGIPELVLVSGYSGTGKSSVVNELHKVLVGPRGRFASGKFDQYKRDIPYATLAQALQSLMRPLLGQSEAELGRWRDALRGALGPNGQLMVNLVPELELVIGKQPPVEELAPQDAKNRFQMVFRRFVAVVARREHPLALFLDDLQWLDAATLDLLEHLLTHSEVRHLLLVGAYRDNEVGPAHPLRGTLEAVRTAGVPVHEIVLAPLGLGDVGRLVADAVHCALARALPLAQLVQEKTGGNPFFAIQFLTALADEGLLAFDPVAPAWQWDMNRIRARSYTDNVMELMAGKLQRLSAATQDALKQLACLGNGAEVATLTLVHGESEEAVHAALAEAVQARLVVPQEGVYRFLHDRIQQAAYSLIPEEQRAEVHLRIGRLLLARMTAEQLAEYLFEVANQFNRGTALLADRNEKAEVATMQLRAGRKAKASSANASACVYLAAGMALLDDRDWERRYPLMSALWLERAECEFLTGQVEKAEQLIGELLQRGASNVAFADASRLKIQLHLVKAEYSQSVDSALSCLRRFGIDLPAHPSQEQVQVEYDTVWQTLDGRPIESLIDLPVMSNPELQAAMQVLSALLPAAYFTDVHLWCLQVCRMVKISLQHGTGGASAHAFAFWGLVLARDFHRYRDAYRFAKLACDLVEKHGFIAYQSKVHYAMGTVAFWTQPITTAIDFQRAAVRAATGTGDLTFACYNWLESVKALLLRNDSLDGVWRESEMALDFAQEAKYGDAVDIIVSLQRFIATMQGRTASFSTFSDAQFDEATFEAHLTRDRMDVMICWYWIIKLQARFLAGEYAEALEAADKVRPLLSAAAPLIQLPDYFYYTALTVAALSENGSADEQARWCELLTAHREQLREWAETYPPTFADKHALVSAEIARLEGRAFDAMHLYEQAIQSARENGFVQNEALAHEVAARFYAMHGFETIADAYLRIARHCYLRWGADGKARQLDQLYPHLREGEPVPGPTSTIGAPLEHLDLATVLKVSQAVSGEIVLEKLIETLLRTAVEHAGAQRGLLIVPRGGELSIQAEASTSGHAVTICLREAPLAATELPESVVHYAAHTHESVILDDASAQNLFSADEYIRQQHARSMLCLPLVKQGALVALLYLENSLTSHAFTPGKVAVLRVLASQAAMTLETSRLYRELREREAKIRRLVEANIIGVFEWKFEGKIIEANDAFFRILGYDREDLVSGRLQWPDLTPVEWRERDEWLVAKLRVTGLLEPFETEYFRKDGSRVPVLIGAATYEGSRNEGLAYVLDLTERKRAEEAARRSEAELRELIQTIPTMAFAIAADGRTEFVSQRWQDYAGLSLEATAGGGWEDTVHPDDLDSHLNKWRASLATGEQFENEVRHSNAKGEYRWFLARAVPQRDEQAQIVKWYGTLTDIEERKRAEEQLRRSEALAEEVVRRSEAYLAEGQRMSHTGSWGWNIATGALFWSREHFRIFGFDAEQAEPSYAMFLERIHPDDRSFVEQRVIQVVDDKRDFEMEFRIVLPGGETKYLRNLGHPVPDDSGAITEIIGTVMDVTEQKRAERAVRRARERALEARFAATLEERTRLAREIHDTLLQGFTGVALQLVAATSRVAGPPEAVGALRDLVDLAQRTLVDARRAVWDMRSPELAAGDFPGTLKAAAKRAVAGTALALDYAVQGAPRLLPPEAEAIVFRVAQEAIANTVKHAAAHTVRVALAYGPRGVRLAVSDDGRGFTVDPDFGAYGGHWGLLGMRERAIQLHAKLTVESAVGAGTAIVLRVPYRASRPRE